MPQQGLGCEDNELEGKEPAASSPSPARAPHIQLLPCRRRANGLGAAHWLAEGQQDLSAQHMEVASWCRAVHHNPIAVVELAHLEVLSEHLQRILVARTGTLRLGSTPHMGTAGSTHWVGIGVVIAHLQEPLWPC